MDKANAEVKAVHFADLAETYREMLSDFRTLTPERRRAFRAKMVAYQNRCAELMAQVQAVQP
jgi:hypothetical protein